MGTKINDVVVFGDQARLDCHTFQRGTDRGGGNDLDQIVHGDVERTSEGRQRSGRPDSLPGFDLG